MLWIEYVGHIGFRSLPDGHLGRHLEYFKTLNDARVASLGFIKYNASTTRINKEKNFKIKFQVILVFYQTTLTNNEHPDEMPHNAAFHQGLHCLLRQNQCSKKFLRSIFCDPLNVKN